MGPIAVIAAALLCSIVALSSANTTPHYFLTLGKEYLYQYESHVNVRIDQPAPYTSLYGLKAKVYIQKTDATTLMVRMDNVVFDLKNGPIQANDNKDVYAPIPTDAEALKLPFAIKYDGNDLVTAMIVDSNDKEWSYNIKKSMASIFQFNNEFVPTFTRKVSHVEYSKEQTVYGLCNVTYDVLPREDHVTVVKTTNPRECENKFNLKRNANFFDVDSNRVYKINTKDNMGRIEMIEARGDLVFAQLRATTEMTTLKVHQIFKFVEEVAITNPFTISNQLVLRSLKYEDPLSKCRDTPVNALVDITGGRAKHNTDVLVPKVQAWLAQFISFVQEDQLTLTKPNSKMIQVLKNLFAVLENFDLSTLEHTFALLLEKSQISPEESRNINLFVQLLPHVGTRSSAVFIRNLIRKEKVDESMAVRVLRDLPAHVHCPNEKLLIELEDLLTIGETGSRIHRASVLAFASLIKRTYLGVDEKSAVLDKYIKLFMQKIQSSEDYNIQVLYVHALGNIGMESVVDSLAPILTGEMEVQRNLRPLALWSVAPLFEKNPSLMNKYIWPILSDRKLESSLRIVAYDIYVRTENPTLNRFMQLYWLMRDESSERFYNFHYNTMVSLSKQRYTKHNAKHIEEIAKAILRLSRRPFAKYENEGTFITDFIDQESGLGGKMDNLYTFGDHINVRSRIMSRLYGFDTEMFSLHFGVAKINYTQKELKEPVTKYLELIVRREGRIVMTYVVAHPTVNTLFFIAKDLGLNIDKAEHNNILEIPYLYERIMPTDFGVPIRMPEMLSHIQSIYFKMGNQPNGAMKFDFQIKSMTFHNTGFRVYNPINNLWHGIDQNKQINLQFGISVSVSQSIQADYSKVYKIKIGKLTKDDVNGFQVHHENVIYIRGENAQELLSQSQKDSLAHTVIVRGEAYKQDTTVFSTQDKTLGQRIEVKIFNCDRDISSGSLMTYFGDFENVDDREGIISLEFLRVYLSTLFPPGYGTCGFGARFTPLESFDHFEFDVTMDARRNSTTPIEGHLPQMVFELDVKGATKSAEGTTLATHNSNFNVTIFDVQRNYAIKWWITHNDGVSKESKLDIDYYYHMKEDKLNSQLTVSIGDVDNLAVFSFDIYGVRSEEQKRILEERKITYSECQPEIIRGTYPAPVPVECAIAHSNLNRFGIHISVNDVEHRIVQMFMDHFNGFRNQYFMYASRKNKKQVTEVFPLHMYVEYPVFRKDEFDIVIDTTSYSEHYTGIPRYQWGKSDISLPNLFFSHSQWDNSMSQCVISKWHVLTMNGNIQKYEMPKEWTSYLKASNIDGTEVYNIFVKNVDANRLAIQVKVGDNVMEITPQENEFSIKVNNNAVTPVVGKYVSEPKWSYLMVESPKMIMFSMKMHGLQVIYDGRTIRLMSRPSQLKFSEGQCLEGSDDEQFKMNSSGFFTSLFFTV